MSSSILFSEFARVCSEIEPVSSSLEISARVADFFRGLNDDDLGTAAHFIMGQVFPAWMEQELGVGPSFLYESIATAYGMQRRAVEDLLRRTGDIGVTAERMCSQSVQRPLFTEELTLQRTYDNFNLIARIEGKRSQKRKVKLLADLLISAAPLEARYLVRLVAEELRIGVGSGAVRDAVANAFDVPANLVERGYMLVNDFGVVAEFICIIWQGREGMG